MTPEEKIQLKIIVQTIGDARGNWDYGWKELCKLAEMDPELYRPHFKTHPIASPPKEQSPPTPGV